MQSSSAKETVLLVERINTTEVWTLNRPDRRNALCRALLQALHEAVGRAAKDTSLRAIVIAATGSQAFCAGADLKERRSMSASEIQEFLELFHETLLKIEQIPIPVIAAIQGTALGGGLELALAADIRVAAADASLGLPEVSLGIIPGAGGTQRLPRVVGFSKAKEMILFSQILSAQKALEQHLIAEIAPDNSSVLEIALKRAAYFEHAAPIAVSAALAAVDQALELPLQEGLAWEHQCYERTLRSEDRLEALKAFEEKRKPVFQGR